MSRSIHIFLLCLLSLALGAAAQTPDPKPVAKVGSALDSALFYQLLLGELNAREGDAGSAYALFLDAARKTGDPRLYQRAVELALQARAGDSALAAARAWRQALPASKEANRYLLQILIGMNRIGEALEPLKRELAAADPKDREAALSAIPRYFVHASDKSLAASTVERALTDYLATPAFGAPAWTVVGRMRLDAGDIAGATEAARKGQAKDAQAQGPVLLAVLLMTRDQPEAELVVKKYLAGQAAQPEVRMEYARALVDAQRLPEAAAQIQIVTDEKPDYAQAWLIRGALALQDGELADAERFFLQYIDRVKATTGTGTGTGTAARTETSRGLVQAYLSLAQIAEQRNDLAQADAWLARIENPQELFNAQLRRATLLARQGKLEDARKLIRSQPEKTADDARLKVVAEAQLLREAKQYQAAYELLAQASALQPDDFDLLYDQAMLAEKLDRMDEMERLLRRIIAAKPDSAQAYNALGFSLAERGTRLPEARELILKALEHAPDDPFITDSLGWVEFRSGNLTLALDILQRAFKAKPDAEIAAHLGEVLWTLDQRDQAINIWREGVKLNAQNEALVETLKRLRVSL